MIRWRPRRPPRNARNHEIHETDELCFSWVLCFRVFRDREWSWFFLGRNRFEIAVDLFLVAGRRLVVGAGGKAILRLLGLQLFRERGLDALERLRRLSTHFLPFREILFERFGAGRRQRHAVGRLEGEATA